MHIHIITNAFGVCWWNRLIAFSITDRSTQHMMGMLQWFAAFVHAPNVNITPEDVFLYDLMRMVLHLPNGLTFTHSHNVSPLPQRL